MYSKRLNFKKYGWMQGLSAVTVSNPAIPVIFRLMNSLPVC
ncbi:MAG: hypothetical protein ACTSX0_06730 [Promethearchaeota archaeon]